QVTPKFGVQAFGQGRIGNSASQFAEELVSAGVTYSPWRFVSLGAGYLYLHSNPNLTGLIYENRQYTEATLRAPAFHRWQIADRARAELRWQQVPPGLGPFREGIFTQRYRNRVIVEHPTTVRNKTIKPYVWFEEFYDTLAGSWNRQRYYAGVE